MKIISKASMVTLAMTASLTMLVTGCGSGGGNSTGAQGPSNSSGSGSNQPAANSGSGGQPVDGGTLTMAQGTKFNDQFIPGMDASLYTANIMDEAFDPLLTIDKNLNFIPDLASKWTWSADKKTVTITLANAKWSDGQPITSDDILFTINYLGSKTYNTTLQGQRGYLVAPILGSDKLLNGSATSFAATGGFKKISNTQFSLTFTKVDAAVLYSDIASIYPIPEHVLKNVPLASWGNASYDKMPTVVSGPYTFTQVNAGQSVEMAANPLYFKGKPHISNLVIKTASPDVVPGLLANGQVQYVLNGLQPTDVAKLKQIPGVVVNTPPGNNYTYLGMKLKQVPEFQNVKFRQAIEYGMDRQAMIDGILKGLGVPENGPVPPVSSVAATAANGLNPYNYDPQKAKSLLTSIGYKMGSNGYFIDPLTGKEATFTLSYNSGDPSVQAQAVAIQSDLKKIGIHVVLNSPLDFNTLAKRVETDDKSIQMWLLGWYFGSYVDPRQLWLSTAAFNFNRWVDPKSDAMINQTWGAQAFDPAYRKQALIKWQLYVNQQLPVNFLYSSDNIYAYGNKLHIPANDWSAQGPLNIQDWWLSN